MLLVFFGPGLKPIEFNGIRIMPLNYKLFRENHVFLRAPVLTGAFDSIRAQFSEVLRQTTESSELQSLTDSEKDLCSDITTSTLLSRDKRGYELY
ncbi:unnamed protein product [Caretta caretta]